MKRGVESTLWIQMLLKKMLPAKCSPKNALQKMLPEKNAPQKKFIYRQSRRYVYPENSLKSVDKGR